MRFIDLHCDTVTECYKQERSLTDNDLHIALNRASFEAWAQLFAIFIPDRYRGQDAWDYFQRNYEFYKTTDVHPCTSVVDMEKAFSMKKCASILGVEGGAVLMGEPERVQTIYDYGVRLLTITWNGENELAYGCQSGDGHLKEAGVEALRELERLHMMVDVSHLNEAGFYDVMERAERPVLASHSTSVSMLMQLRAPSEDRDFVVRRALTDDQVRALREHGGLIGLNFYNRFLGDEGNNGREALLRHIDHLLEVGGEDLLAIGSDFDGCRIQPEMAGVEKIPDLFTYLAENGLGKALCEKIFFNNAFQFIKSVL